MRNKSKTKIIVGIVAIVLVIAGFIYGLGHLKIGNRSVGFIDTQTFNRFQLNLNGDTIDGLIKFWRDFNNSDTIQILAEDGKTYLTHYMNVILIKDN